MTKLKLENWARKCMHEYSLAFGLDAEMRALIPADDWPFENADFVVFRADEGGEFVFLRERKT